mgnify:FL=1
MFEVTNQDSIIKASIDATNVVSVDIDLDLAYGSGNNEYLLEFSIIEYEGEDVEIVRTTQEFSVRFLVIGLLEFSFTPPVMNSN